MKIENKEENNEKIKKTKKNTINEMGLELEFG
jgi:hypothetical protein